MSGLIIYDGYYVSFSLEEFKEELKKLDYIGFEYIGFDRVAEEDFRHCYAFMIKTNDRDIPLWTNTKRRKEQLERILQKR